MNPKIRKGLWEEVFYLWTTVVVSVIAAKGTGKTYIATCWAIKESLHVQVGTIGLVTFTTQQQCRDVYEQFFKPIFEFMGLKDGIHFFFNKSSMNLYYANGSIVHFRSAEESTLGRIETLQYTWWWGDECQAYTPRALKTFNSRVRKGLKRVRITAMPDEPSAFIYKFVENIQAKQYELTLHDNPDKDFAKGYEITLRQTYTGAELDRYLFGKRVSLTGTGMFGLGMQHRSSLKFDRSKETTIVWDFNVEYCAVSFWQRGAKTTKGQKAYCPLSFQLKQATAYENAMELVKFLLGVKKFDCPSPTMGDLYLGCVRSGFRESYVKLIYDENEDGNGWNLKEGTELVEWGKITKEVEGLIVLDGDASGDSRSTMAHGSEWTQVLKAFRDAFGSQVLYGVGKSNPSVKDTIECCNWALLAGMVEIDDVNAMNLYNSVVSCKYDKHGGIDKANDYKDGAVKSHDADTFRYALWRFYKHQYAGARKLGLSVIKV